ncbi:MAG: M14 family metallopeptidase [Bacteroidia bacterium]|nr:M14 family metallopeptidase [Bacteroidia bacterium]
MKRLILILTIAGFLSCESVPEEKSEVFKTYFELTEEQETPPYEEVISFYKELAREYASVNIQTIGETDSGYPLHIVTFNPEADFNFQRIREDKLILLINNGIHPGESDGIDASMLLFRDFATEKIKAPEGTVVVAIPVYNIGGALNRNSSTRVNQNGPKEYGFRGNARNYDLNRDFIKNDTKNARSFARIYHLVQPDVFIDTHVSNGADYQYTLTHLFTQHDKLGGDLGAFVDNTFRPQLEVALSEEGWDMTPYVNVFNRPPQEGFSKFLDHPRYSTGYTALWHTLGFMIETHMLKPYPKRVWGTYEVLKQAIALSDQHKDTIKELRQNMRDLLQSISHYPIRWALDSTKISRLNFKGYESERVLSEVTGLERLKYDRSKPFTTYVALYDGYKVIDSIAIPEGYIIPKGWEHILDLMSSNGIESRLINKDTLMELEVYTIDSYATYSSAYEGHYPHYNTRVKPRMSRKQIHAGDHFIPAQQPGIRYLLETLEPGSNDSFFNWNFFDAILQQKEGFSPYVFEDLAYDFLQANDSIAKSFKQKKEEDEAFRNNGYAQLRWIYERTDHYEEAHRQYPVYRVPSSGQ